MKTLVAAIALLPLLALSTPALAEGETTAGEIEARLGPPQAREFVPCGGQDPRDQARCIRWRYDQGTLHTAYYFDVRTQELLEVSAWDEETRQASSTSSGEQHVVPTTRVAAGP